MEEAVCYACAQPAIGTCRGCGRPICQEHLVPYPEDLVPLFGPDACQRCVERAIEEVERGRRQRERKRSQDVIYRTCEICNRVFEQVLPSCSVCNRRVCYDHRVRYRRRFFFGNRRDPVTGAWYWDYQVRCVDHRRHPWIARLTGWEIDHTPPEADDRAELWREEVTDTPSL